MDHHPVAACVLPSYFPDFALHGQSTPPNSTSPMVGSVTSDTPDTSPPTVLHRSSDEPLLNEEEEGQRFVLFPIRHQDVWAMCKKALSALWTVEEVDLSQDMKDWRTLAEGEKKFLVVVLSFFAASDGVVNENLACNFYKEIQCPEVRYFYGVQIMIETIHSEMYSTLIDKYLEDDAPALKNALRALHTIPCVAAKANWASRWTDPATASFAERLVAFACVEGIFFSASFCAIFWMKKRGLMPGLCFSNELIARDEGLHCDFACMLVRHHLRHPPSAEVITAIVDSAVQCELRFVAEALHISLIGMNADLMGQYVKFVADRLLNALGASKLYHVPNPFDWMEMISVEGRTNFFERRVGEYARAHVGVGSSSGSGSGSGSGGGTDMASTTTAGTASDMFSLDEDF